MKSRLRQGFSLIELLIVVTIILIIAAIAIPKLLTVKQLANSTAAVANLRSINNALSAYSTQYPAVGYPATLASLSGTGNNPSSTSALLVDTLLTRATIAATPKQGYFFTYTVAAERLPVPIPCLERRPPTPAHATSSLTTMQKFITTMLLPPAPPILSSCEITGAD